MIGKYDIACDVMRFSDSSRKEDVRFFREGTFQQIINALGSVEHKTLTWLAWDVGENIFTLINLQKKDFIRNQNSDNGEIEYMVRLSKEKIKKSRTERTEPVLHTDTVELLELILKDLQDDDQLFKFGERQAAKFLRKAVDRVNGRCEPAGQRISWKDFRSSMACHLLSSSWSTDEVKSRLGHTPSSRAIDKYVNYLALNKQQSKKKTYVNNIQKVREDLLKVKDENKLKTLRQQSLQTEIELLKTKFGEREQKEEQVSKGIIKLVQLLKQNPEALHLLAKNKEGIKEVFY